MLYQVIISKVGCVEDVVEVKAGSALEAIDVVEAAYEKFGVLISTASGELTTALWSGYEFEARALSGFGKTNLPVSVKRGR